MTVRLRVTAVLAGLLITFQAAAHSAGTSQDWWSLDPWVWVPLTIFCVLYLRGVLVLRKRQRTSSVIRMRALAAFSTGMGGLFLALIWPLDALGEVSFAAHMAQHMLLIAVAAPLLVLARPSVPVALALSGAWPGAFSALARARKIFRLALRPDVAFFLHASVIWLWHAPLLFEAALIWQWLHIIEHACFLGTGMLFWTALYRAGRSGDGNGTAALWTLATLVHTGMLGALITFSPRLLYEIYGGTGNGLPLTPMEDQQLAGLIMWIPAGLCYLIAGVGFAAAWLRHAARNDVSRLPDAAPLVRTDRA